MTKVDFVIGDVARKVRALAAKRPDFVYTAQAGRILSEGCSYISAGRDTPGGEGCIVGQALSALGVSDKTLEEFEGNSAAGVITKLVVDGDITRLSRDEENTLIWLDNVQINQDLSRSWGMAVESADDGS